LGHYVDEDIGVALVPGIRSPMKVALDLWIRRSFTTIKGYKYTPIEQDQGIQVNSMIAMMGHYDEVQSASASRLSNWTGTQDLSNSMALIFLRFLNLHHGSDGTYEILT
jgi:hypothetical protein